MTYNPGEALFEICLLVTLGERGMPVVIAVWVDDVASIKFFLAKDGEFKTCLLDRREEKGFLNFKFLNAVCFFFCKWLWIAFKRRTAIHRWLWIFLFTSIDFVLLFISILNTDF